MRMGLNALGWVGTTQKKIKVVTVNYLLFLNKGFAHCIYFLIYVAAVKEILIRTQTYAVSYFLSSLYNF